MRPDKKLVQQLVRENLGIRGKIENPRAPGGDPSLWTLKDIEKSQTPNDDLAPYTDRYYLIFYDGGGHLGHKVKISGNYDPNSRRWDKRTFHFSSDQPNPEKWGDDGKMRNVPDPGEDENPTSHGIDEWLLGQFGDD